MNEKQYDIIQKLEDEYTEYIDSLLLQGKHTIISSSDKTVFYANILSHLQEHEVSATVLTALDNAKEPLFALYRSYMDNNEDLMARERTATKMLYVFQKEQRFQNQM